MKVVVSISFITSNVTLSEKKIGEVFIAKIHPHADLYNF